LLWPGKLVGTLQTSKQVLQQVCHSEGAHRKEMLLLERREALRLFLGPPRRLPGEGEGRDKSSVRRGNPVLRSDSGRQSEGRFSELDRHRS